MKGGSRFDLIGSATSIAAVAIFLLLMTNAGTLGWTSPLAITALAAVILLVVVFIWWERKTPEPMMALDLFKSRLFTLWSAASFLHFMSGTSVFFLMPFHLQKVAGYSPAETGLIMAPTAICFAVFGPIAGRLSDKFGWRPFVVSGLLMSLTSLILLSRIAQTDHIELVIVTLAIQGAGMGMFFSPNASAILSTVDRSRYGIATAFLNMARNTANVAGLAVATTIVVIVMGSQGYQPTLEAVGNGNHEGVQAAFTDGLRRAFLVMAAFAGLATVLSVIKGGATFREPEAPDPDIQASR